MRNLITLYIGMFDKNKKRQILSLDAFKQHLDIEFDCYTLTQCEGRYKHEDGIIINEPTLKVEIVNDNLLIDKDKIEKLKNLLNQECIMVTTQELHVDFI